MNQRCGRADERVRREGARMSGCDERAQMQTTPCFDGGILRVGETRLDVSADLEVISVPWASKRATVPVASDRSSRALNKWADAGDILTLTKRINGGTIGLEDRIKHYEHALHIFGD